MHLIGEWWEMKFKTKYVLAFATVLCMVIVPAMSQDNDRAGMNGMQDNGMVQPGNQGLNTFQSPAPFDQGNGNGIAPPHEEKKFLGCNTLPMNPKDKKPIDKTVPDNHPPNKPEGSVGPAPANPEQPSRMDPAGWVYQGKEPMNKEFGINPANPGRNMGPRPIMHDSQKGKAPEKAPEKSIMMDWHKKIPRPLMESYHRGMPPIKSIMGHLI